MKKLAMMALVMVAVAMAGITVQAAEAENASLWSRIKDAAGFSRICSIGCIRAKDGFSNALNDYTVFRACNPTTAPDGRSDIYIKGPYPDNLIGINENTTPVDGLQVYCRAVNIPDSDEPQMGAGFNPSADTYAGNYYNEENPLTPRTEWLVHRVSGCIVIPGNEFLCSFRGANHLFKNNSVVDNSGRRLECIVGLNHFNLESTPGGVITLQRAIWLTENDKNLVLNGPHSPSLIVNDVNRDDEPDNVTDSISVGTCTP